MPGKVDPTHCETIVMVCIQVLSEDSAIAFAGTHGNFELNAMRPVIISSFLHAATILADACAKLRQYCIEGTELNRGQVDDYVNRSRAGPGISGSWPPGQVSRRSRFLSAVPR